MSGYDLLRELSKQYTMRERDDMALLLLRRLQTLYNWSAEDIHTIWKACDSAPRRCSHVRKEGLCRGTKCRRPVKHETVIQSDTNTAIRQYLFCRGCSIATRR